MKHEAKKVLWIGFFLLGVTACSSVDPISYDQKNASESVLLAKSKIALSQQKFYDSVQYLRAIDQRFPFSNEQELINRMLVFALYASEQYSEAALEADAYLATHAYSEGADYVYYLSGLIAFEKNKSWFRQKLGYDESSRDMKSMRLAYDRFIQLTQRFPKSRFAHDAIFRASYIKNLLAKSEWKTAAYYYEKHAFHAALARLDDLITHYPDSIYTSRAQTLKQRILRKYHMS